MASVKILVDRPVLTIRGEPFDPPVTVRSALYMACVNPAPGDERMGYDEKLRWHALGTRIALSKDEVVEVKPEDFADLKRRMAATFSVHLLGQVNATLERDQEQATVRELVANGKHAEAADRAA